MCRLGHEDRADQVRKTYKLWRLVKTQEDQELSDAEARDFRSAVIVKDWTMKTVQSRSEELAGYGDQKKDESSKDQRTKRSKSGDPRSQDQDLSWINE